MLSYISTTWDQVQHLDVPTSERLSRCDRILGAACVKRRALKKLEPAERLPPAYVLELWLILLFARIIIIINFIYTIVTFSIKKATLATCIFRLSLPIDLYTTFCHSLSLSYMGIKEQSPRKPGIFPLPPLWEVTVPSILMAQLRMPQNMADRLANTVGSDTAGQIRQLQHLLGPSFERRDLVFTLLASR
ncbi:hypothetical protein BFJ70_g13189 [Fusarium oxysporum]|nr:hypothetical protein BFJ67_g12871 [Fusarium oxysporum f. sp. cepae]RKK39710.1 hypothetical protein BFJ66_g11831 [Fusarium oxysporum f. sp. cepae]RKL22712.1 hypothetical protein BFJ70_g13189 [Fusarium oxysporum]